MKKSILFIQFAMLLILFAITITKSVESYKFNKNKDEINNYNDNRIIEENEFYEMAINSEYENQNSQKPYIPEGFSYVEGEWNSGFVIQDANGNQYVWVPCTNEENSEIPKLERKDFSEDTYISIDTCINENCEKFISSSLENGGFYISRYEIGKQNDLPVSKPEVEILSNITRNETKKIISEMYKDKDFSCELINGYAYDTTLSWIKNTNDIKTNKIENRDSVKTGRAKYNNIYDFIDNVLEITSESSYGTVIIRGFLFEDDDSFSNEELLENLDYDITSFNRLSIREEDNYYTLENIMGFRTVIYK